MVRFLCPLVLFLASAAHAQSPLTAEDRRGAVSRIADLLRTRFYDAARADRCVRPMEAALRRGGYDHESTPEAFAARLTRELAGCGDRHLLVSADPAPPSAAPAGPGIPAAPANDELRHRYARRNFDFREVRLLEGNVGYLRLYTFAPARMGGDTAAAAMRLLSNADAVIIDLRGNRGGYPDMGLLLASYFFDRPTHYANIYRREGDRTEQQWTMPFVPGPRLTTQPLYIVIGHDSFSGAESLAYNLQALGRAVIVGEPSGGGATGVNTIRVDDRFTVVVADVNFTSPRTGRNWEGTGVIPDLPAAYADAPRIAHQAALHRLAESERDEARRRELQWAAELVGAAGMPPAQNLAALAGRYGTRAIRLESGHLYYRNGENPLFRLVSVGEDEFLLAGEPTMRLRFHRDSAGNAIRLVLIYADGDTIDLARETDAR